MYLLSLRSANDNASEEALRIRLRVRVYMFSASACCRNQSGSDLKWIANIHSVEYCLHIG